MNISFNKIILLFAAILFIAVFWRFESLLYFPDSSILLQKGNTVKLNPESTLTQKFSASKNYLAKIEVLLRGSGVKYKDGDKVTTKIADENCQTILREGEIKDSFLETQNLHEFEFEPIVDSAGKEFCFIATFLPKNEKAKSLQFFTMEEENQPYSIRPVYKNSSITQDLSELNQRISQYKPWFLKHFYLYAIVILFLATSAAIVVILILV